MFWNQTWYDVAPSIGVQRTSPAGAGNGVGTVSDRMSKPYDAVHGPTAPFAAIARTRAYSEWGLPVIHGRASGTVPTGVVREGSSQTIPFPRKSGLMERTSSYFFAPAPGLHAKAGVRAKECPGCSLARNRNARKFDGARSLAALLDAAEAGAASASTARGAAKRRAILCVVGSF